MIDFALIDVVLRHAYKTKTKLLASFHICHVKFIQIVDCYYSSVIPLKNGERMYYNI